MLDFIKVINDKNKQKLKGTVKEYRAIHTLRIEKRSNMYYLVNHLGKVIIQISTLDFLVVYLKNSDCYISNLSLLKDARTLYVHMITETEWLEIVNKIGTLDKYNSFIIKKVSDLREYISKLVLTRRVSLLIETKCYSLILLNNKDLVLVSELKLKVNDDTELMFFGHIKYIKIENLDVSDVTDLSFTFQQMYNTEVIELSNFDLDCSSFLITIKAIYIGSFHIIQLES